MATVILDGKDRFIESGDADNLSAVPLTSLIPLGTLDYPPRPRATSPLGTELAYGFVLRHRDQVVSLMLPRKADVAVLAILAGWRSPNELSHGQDAAEIASAAD